MNECVGCGSRGVDVAMRTMPGSTLPYRAMLCDKCGRGREIRAERPVGVRPCATCGEPVTKRKPGPGRYPSRCESCRAAA